MRILRQRAHKAKPIKDIVRSYAVVMLILVAFLAVLVVLAVVELLLLGS